MNALIARRGLNTYVEPYAGGAGAAIDLLLNDAVQRIVINDLDRAIYAFWKSVTVHTDELLRLIEGVELTLEEWRRQQAIYRNPDDHTDLDLGFATFFLNRTNRSGVMNAGVIGGQAQSGKYRIDARFDRDLLSKRVQKIAERRNRIRVTNVDGAASIRQALRLRSALIYADPPYYEKGSFLYLNSFDDTQHEKLSLLLNKYSEANWVLTYDDHARIRELYAKRIYFNYGLNYSAHRTGKHAELMVVSDSISTSIAKPSTSE
jgi:DNA adenine methylase